MTVGVPQRALPLQERGPLLGGEAVPQPRGVRTQTVERGPPVAVGADGPADVPVDGPAQRGERRRVEPVGGVHRRGGAERVRLGQQPAPGDGVHGAPGPVEAERQVDGCESRADEQHVGGAGERTVEGAGRPGGPYEALGGSQSLWRPVAPRGGRPGGEHRAVGRQMSPGGELELHPAAGGAGTALRPRPQPAYGDRAVGADDRLGQGVGEVGAVPVPGGEVGALDGGFAVPAEPAGEVSGVVRVATHAARGHIEPMPWVGRGVRGAASGLRRRVDQDEVEGHPAARGRLAQLDRRQRAGGARSDDGHGVPLAG